METISEAPRFIKKLVDLGFDVRMNSAQNQDDFQTVICDILYRISPKSKIIGLTERGCQLFPATIYGAIKGSSAVICAVGDQTLSLDAYNLLLVNLPSNMVEEAEREFFPGRVSYENDF